MVDVTECASERYDSASPSKMATLGLSKVFILDKYFTELQKFWETEKKLQGKQTLAGFVNCSKTEQSCQTRKQVDGVLKL